MKEPSPPSIWQRLGNGYKVTAVLMLNTLILLLIFEVVAGQINAYLDARNDEQFIANMASPSYFQGQPWVVDYWREHRQQQVRYNPYTIWRTAPYSGTTITVNADGYRQTPGARCEPGAYTVFVFGGSAVWGHGSPDWGTIPAYLQSALDVDPLTADGRERPVCVQNLGEKGYVSTQELIELQRQLQQGHIPDLVIFYDGANDASAVYQSGEAGAHMEQFNIADRLENDPTLLSFILESDSFLLLHRGAVKLGLLPPAPETQMNIQPALLDADQLIDQLFQGYLANVQTAVALADAYGFQVHFFWQPVLGQGHKTLTAEEEAVQLVAPELTTYYQKVYAQAWQIAPQQPCLTNLANVFDAQTDPIWIDWVHVTPQGNAIIAEEIARIVRENETEAGCRGPG